jgi:hypothetical protein
MKKHRRIAFAAIAVAGLAVAFLCYGYWEAGQIRVVEQEVFFDDLPAAFDGFRIVQLADLHVRDYGRVERRLHRILERVPADLLVVVGDFKSEVSAPDEPILDALARLFGSVDYPWGRLACSGNHDSPDFLAQLPSRLGFTRLCRSSIVLERGGDSLAFLGVATLRPLDGGRGINEIEESTWVGNVALRIAPHGLLPDSNALPLACARLNDGKLFRILLAHTPEFVPRASQAGIQLVLAGDTHGGQVRLPLIGPLWTKSRLHRRYCRGLGSYGSAQICVTPGTGTLGVPIRFLCPPEVTVLTLRRR